MPALLVIHPAREWCRDNMNMARFDTPRCVVAAHSSGNLYVADRASHTIRKIEYK